MTKEELKKTHPDYARHVAEWQFFIRSYFGGILYREGNYLLKHPFESGANYERRKSTAYYYNYCGPIVDIFVSHLFRRPASRDYGSMTGNALFESFLEDADLEGSNFTQFMREAARFASIYGRVSIVVDKPEALPLTEGDAIALGIRPYVSLVTPENLLDWDYGRLSSGRPVLETVKIKESRNVYRIWTREGWELYRLDEDSSQVELVSSGSHSLGRVPVVNLYNKLSGVRMLGTSDIQDIADINKNIYYLCSDAKEIIENTAFPMLALPYEKGGGEEEKQVGPRNILQFDPELSNSRPYWLEAPHSSLTEIREWVNQDISEIFRIAKMGGVKASEDFYQPKSGAALELEYQQLYSSLSEKADNLEQAEMEILNLWALWQGVRFDGKVDYPDDFSAKDMDREFEKAIKAQSLRIESPLFKKTLEKALVELLLPKASDEVKKTITEEIDGGKD